MISAKPIILPRLGVALIAACLAIVLYVLSLGPALWLVERHYVSEAAITRAYLPLEWLCDRSDTFKAILFWYVDKWLTRYDEFEIEFSSGQSTDAASPLCLASAHE